MTPCCTSFGRREFLGLAGAGLVAGGVGSSAGAEAGGAASERWPADLWDPDRPFLTPGSPLVVQPILMYATPQKRPMTSWKSWGGVQSDETAAAEAERIARELGALASGAAFPLKVLPVATVKSPEEAARARDLAGDVILFYPATGSGTLFKACLPEGRDALVFVRHCSGPVYYWYEALSVKYLCPEVGPGRLSIDDVVVDDPAELAWRLRALSAVKNFRGSKIVALGGAGGKYAPDAPKVARESHKLDIVEVTYESFAPRIAAALADGERRALAQSWARRYLALPGTRLETERGFVENSFILYGAIRDLMASHGASAFTIGACMGTIMPLAQTTACLALEILNDEGRLAFCESDFVIVPAGMLLRHLAGTPVFLHNSTFPHGGVVTCAHCTAPRRMDGARYEAARILTHYESEYGAAPKAEYPPGQKLTFIDPEYATGRWVGFTGTVIGNPFYEICRSQQDVAIDGDWRALLAEARDSHWVMVYGDRLKEAEYAARKAGIRWQGIA